MDRKIVTQALEFPGIRQLLEAGRADEAIQNAVKDICKTMI